MVTALLIGVGCIFFILGHSTLLFFKSKGSTSMPIVDAIFPWPKKGKFVSVLCLGLSAVSFILMFSLPSEIQSSVSHSAWKILTIFAVFPSAVYALYLVKRIRNQPEGLVYFPSDATRQEWSLPLLISAFVFVVFWIFT
jgi:hypothetical protein